MVQKINEAQTMTTKNHFSFYPACISFLVFPCTKSIRPKVGNSGSVFFSYRLKHVSFIQIDITKLQHNDVRLTCKKIDYQFLDKELIMA